MSKDTEANSSKVSGFIEPPSAALNAHNVDLTTGTANLKFDHLGPVVVNSDGVRSGRKRILTTGRLTLDVRQTLSRIGNWATMTEGERERTLRVLGKRNQLRVAQLRESETKVPAGEQK